MPELNGQLEHINTRIPKHVDEQLYTYLLMLGDNAMIQGHRLSELCGHGPSLETDIALTNISLDLFGQVRGYFQYAAKVKGGDLDEDKIAFLRYERQYRNVVLVEQPNTDFAFTIGRQFLFDAFHLPLLGQLQHSQDEQLAAIATKSIKEVKYHLTFSTGWIKRLGGGTEESQGRMQAAIDHLYPFTGEFFDVSKTEAAMYTAGIGADLGKIKATYQQTVKGVCLEAGLTLPDTPPRKVQGKQGIHSEHMGDMLAKLQYMQRAYPDMQW